MRNKLSAFLALTLFPTLLYLPSASFAQSTAFTYQGRLNDGANPATGIYDLRFTIYDLNSGGAQQGGPFTNTATTISNGLFTVTLDFGNQFPGADRWLEIGVRTNGGAAFSTLTPRQAITATPYAVRALGAGSAASYTGVISDGQLSGNIPRLDGSNMFSGPVLFTNSNNTYAGTFSGNGASLTNVLLATLNAPGILTWPGNFALASSPDVGNAPRSVVAADVNGDGKLDLISANSGANTLSVLTNNGSGGFGLAATYSGGFNPRSVTAADLNGDGKPDLICTRTSPGALMVLTNLGNGSFVSASTNILGPTTGNVQFIVAADINGDGVPDLISANGNSSPGTLTVLTNNGIGGFGSPTQYSVGNNPFALAVADIDGDGTQDLISANNIGSGTLSVLTNNGSGGFVSASTNSVGNSPRSVTTADVNGDGSLDLISANIGDSTLSVLLNNGSGIFAPGIPVFVGNAPIGVTAVELNGDGKVDLVCANNTSPGTLTAVTNIGSGFFLPAFTKSVGGLPYLVIGADVNGDTKVDLVSVNGTTPGTLSVLFNVPTFTGSGAGLFNIPADAITGGLTTNLAVLVPGGFTNTLFFTNGILRAIQ